MNDKVKKILKYLGVAFLGAVIGCSTLIAVSSCNAKTQTQVKQAGASSLDNLEGTYRGNNLDSYYIYDDTIHNYLPVDKEIGYVSSYNVYYKTIIIDLNVYNENQSYVNSVNDGIHSFRDLEFRVWFQSRSDGTAFLRLSSARMYYNDGDGYSTLDFYNYSRPGASYELYCDYSDNYPDYSYFYLPSSYYFDISWSAQDLEMTGLEKEYCLNSFIQYFNDYFTLINNGVNFTFNDLINYNAPYGTTTNELFVQSTAFYSGAALTVTKSYLVGPFISNGRVFNEIIFSYVNALGTRFINTDGTTSVLGVENYGYFQAIFYKNNYTLEQVDVCYRNYGQYPGAGGNFQTYLDYGCNWVNNDYKKLYFIDGLNSEQRDILAQFNNNINLTGISVYGGDVGLSNVFDLLKLSFASWIPILNVTVIPGITIGLLLFLPLIITIVITIIWLIKR